MNKVSHSLTYIIGFIALFATTLAFSAEDSQPRALESVYMGVSVNSVYPIGLGQQHYSSGGVSPAFHYRYVMHDEWLLGASAGFKILKDLEGTEDPLFCVEQKTTRLLRVYYPFWLGFGISALYMVGVEKIDFPYQRKRDVPIQIGAGIHTMLLYRASSNVVAHAEINRWGGTMARNKVNVLEASLGLTYALTSDSNKN